MNKIIVLFCFNSKKKKYIEKSIYINIYIYISVNFHSINFLEKNKLVSS